MPHRAPDRANSRFFFLGAFSETSRPFHPTIVPHLRRPLLSRLAVFCIYRGISQRHSGRARQRAGGRPTGDRDRDTCADAHDGDGRAEARLDSDDRASQEGGLVRSGLREGRLRDWLHCGPQTARDEEHSCGKPHTHSHIPSAPLGPYRTGVVGLFRAPSETGARCIEAVCACGGAEGLVGLGRAGGRSSGG